MAIDSTHRSLPFICLATWATRHADKALKASGHLQSLKQHHHESLRSIMFTVYLGHMIRNLCTVRRENRLQRGISTEKCCKAACK